MAQRQDIKIVGPTKKDYHCSICHLVLNEPHLTDCCGHSFCKQCLDAIKAAHKPCPECKQEEFSYMVDRRTERELSDLTVECTAKEEGCTWTGKLWQFKTHIEDECIFTEVDCRWKCGEKLQRRHLSQHEECSCPKRPWYTNFQCPNARDLAQKVEVIAETLQSNDQQLTRQVETFQSSNHQLTTQVKTLQSSNQQLATQVESNNPQLTRQVEALQSQLSAQVEKLARNLQTQASNQSLVTNLTTKLDAVTVEHDRRTEELKVQIEQLLSENQKLKVKVESLARRNSLELESKSPSPQNSPMDKTLSSEIRICPLKLQMDRFSSRKSNDSIWNSGSFYSSINGYKMCIRVFTGGAAEGKHSHVSLYVYLMRGDFDEQLKWPFQGTMNVTLLNQSAEIDHHQCAIDFRADSEASKRVVMSGRSIHGLGYPDYIPLADLQKDGEVEYLKDDCLKFEVSVEVKEDQTNFTVSKIPVIGKIARLFSGK